MAQGAVCGPLCALVGLRVRSVSGSRGRWSAQVRAHGQNRDRTWAHGRPQCQYHWGVHCRLHTLSVLCSCAVVALLPALYACRQIAREVVKWCCGGLPPPGKGPSPAVWGEGLYRTSPGAPAASSSLRHLYWSRAKTIRRVALHLVLSIPRRSVETAISARSCRYPLSISGP